jgi:hypothetical protein
MDSNSIVTNIECKYDVRAIESEVKGLYYLEDDENKSIGILVIKNDVPMHIVLSKKQAKQLAKEFREVVNTVFNM